jgi:hypothetical protein
MGMRDFRGTQVLASFLDEAKRAFTYHLKMRYGFRQSRKTAPRPRLIGSIKTHAAIGTTTENATITLRFFLISRLPFARHQSERDFFCHGHVFRALEDGPPALCRPQARSGFTDSDYAVKKSFSSPA